MISSIIHRAFPQLLSTPTSSPARLGVATLESCHIQHYTYFTSGYNNLHALANNQHALANNLQKSPRFKTSKYILVQFPSAPCCHARIMITGITFWQTINGLFSSQFIILGQPSSPCVWWANIWELYGQGNRVSSTKYDYSPITARHWIHIYLLFNQTMKHYTLNILVSYIIHIHT